jgi:hypothetical protein
VAKAVAVVGLVGGQQVVLDGLGKRRVEAGVIEACDRAQELVRDRSAAGGGIRNR